MNMIFVTRIYNNGMNAGQIAATAEPAFFAGRMLPKRFNKLKAVAFIFTNKQTAGVGAYP